MPRLVKERKSPSCQVKTSGYWFRPPSFRAVGLSGPPRSHSGSCGDLPRRRRAVPIRPRGPQHERAGNVTSGSLVDPQPERGNPIPTRAAGAQHPRRPARCGVAAWRRHRNPARAGGAPWAGAHGATRGAAKRSRVAGLRAQHRARHARPGRRLALCSVAPCRRANAGVSQRVARADADRRRGIRARAEPRPGARRTRPPGRRYRYR